MHGFVRIACPLPTPCRLPADFLALPPPLIACPHQRKLLVDSVILELKNDLSR